MSNKPGRFAWLCGFFGVMLSMPVLAAVQGSHNGLDALFGHINSGLAWVFFADILFFVDGVRVPFIVAWLAVGSIYFTVRMGFINFRVVGHTLNVLRGRYARPEDAGEVSPFQALTTALSATVGLGNIAGVAIAVGTGGPGATFWMILAGLLGMSTKFTEATLAQRYRVTRPDGHVMGGAMEYLARGLAEKGWPQLGKGLAVLFCLLTVGASLGAGNSFQVSQSLSAVKQSLPFLAEMPWIYGLLMALLVGVVIIGGIRRIARTATAIVPPMVVIYLLACGWIILSNLSLLPGVFALIFNQAFTLDAGFGGFIGVLVIGFQRAAFSSEAGIGSAAIAHSTARTPYPVRQGMVALMEPFIDTVLICTMTALVIIITGVYADEQYAPLVAQNQGAALTSVAFSSAISWFPLVLSATVVLFAYSTMISWSYYGERCWTYLFGERSSMAYRVVFILFVVIGSVTSATNILNFSDLLVLAMALPNIIALYILSGTVKRDLLEYLDDLRQGKFVLTK